MAVAALAAWSREGGREWRRVGAGCSVRTQRGCAGTNAESTTRRNNVRVNQESATYIQDDLWFTP